MREYKFRLWDKKYKMFDYNFSPDVFIGTDGVVFEKDERTFGMESYTVYEKTDNYIISQYTGLKDRNGKEIYEGDIVKFNDFDSLRTGGHTEDNILQGDISFSCGTWIVKTEKGHHDLYTAIVNDEEIEIIGNKFTNSELLQS